MAESRLVPCNLMAWPRIRDSLPDQKLKMGIPLTHVKFYWTVFAKTHHAAPPQDLNASPAKWLFAALEARPVFRITGATCVKGIPIKLIIYHTWATCPEACGCWLLDLGAFQGALNITAPALLAAFEEFRKERKLVDMDLETGEVFILDWFRFHKFNTPVRRRLLEDSIKRIQSPRLKAIVEKSASCVPREGKVREGKETTTTEGDKTSVPDSTGGSGGSNDEEKDETATHDQQEVGEKEDEKLEQENGLEGLEIAPCLTQHLPTLTLPPTMSLDVRQQLLDELAGVIQVGGIKKSPSAFLLGIVKRVNTGEFKPDLALKVAAERVRRAANEAAMVAARAVNPAMEQPKVVPISSRPPGGSIKDFIAAEGIQLHQTPIRLSGAMRPSGRSL